MILLIKLVLAHLIGDFYLQPTRWVTLKKKRKWLAYPLYLHALVHGVLIMLLIWNWTFWPWALGIAVAHLVIDGIKVSLQKEETKREWFFIDQLAHILSLYLIYCWYGGHVIFNTAWLTETNFLIATMLVFLTTPCSYVVKAFISRWLPEGTNTSGEALHDAGMYIGIIERLFVFAFVLMNRWEAIGFLLAAKSVFRFGDLTRAQDRKLTEYILVGTLLSFGIAIVAGVVTRHYIS